MDFVSKNLFPHFSWRFEYQASVSIKFESRKWPNNLIFPDFSQERQEVIGVFQETFNSFKIPDFFVFFFGSRTPRATQNQHKQNKDSNKQQSESDKQ